VWVASAPIFVLAVEFADSPLEGTGFEPSIPRGSRSWGAPAAEALSHVTRIGCRVGVAFFDHVALTSRLALSAEFRPPAIELKDAPALPNNAQTDEVSVAQLN
jgi:hypothetical protein